MQTRTYGELIDLIQSLIGAGTMTGDEYLKLSNFINRRYSEAYNTSPSWTRYIASGEERKVAALTLSGGAGSGADNTEINQSYQFIGLADGGDTGTGNSVSGSKVYQGLTNTNNVIFQTTYDGSNKRWYVGTDITVSENADGTIAVSSFDTPGDQEFGSSDLDAPESFFDVKTFTANPTAGQTGTLKVKGPLNLVPYDESGLDSISEYIRIHRKQPFIDTSAIEYDFFVDVDGANILNISSGNDNTAFVTYKKPLTLFTVAVSDPPVAADFVDGGTVNGAANRALTVPLEFFSYLAHASYADFLRVESKYEDARTEEAIAQNYLAQELEKIDIRNNNNSLNKKFSTYVNRQSR